MTSLDKALQAALADRSKAGEFYNVFLQANLFIPTHDKPEAEGQRRASEDETFNPIILENEGIKVLLIFDQLERLEAFANRDLGYIVLPGHVIVDSIPEGINWVLNHGTDHVKEFALEEIQFLKSQIHRSAPDPVAVPEGAKVLVGVPATVPDGLTDALTDCCERNPEIVAAHLGQIYIGTAGEVPHLALMISTTGVSDAAKSAIATELVAAARSKLGADDQLELLIDQPGQMTDGIRKEVPPFYSGSAMN